jgi:predicted small secreted protein
MRQKVIALFIFLGLSGMLIGCNTIHGLGEDIEQGGKKTQEAADSVKKEL